MFFLHVKVRQLFKTERLNADLVAELDRLRVLKLIRL